MTVMEEVLVEEYMRALRIERLVQSEIEELPKGSIQKKENQRKRASLFAIPLRKRYKESIY